jgi:1,2-phenylacetyl-CoA epoxidase catalytic subunit
MPKKQSPEKQIQRLIAEAFRSYILAAKNRRRALEHCDMAFDVKKWQAKAPPLTRLAAVLARVCDTISHELQILYAIEERLRQNTDKSLHIVIEHVDSPWRPEAGPLPQLHPADTGQSEA